MLEHLHIYRLDYIVSGEFAYVGFSGIKRKIFKLEETMVCKLSTWVEPDSFGNLKFSHAEKLYPARKGSVIWNGSASGVNTKKFNIDNKNIWRTEIRKKYNIPEEAKVFIYCWKELRKIKVINELFAASAGSCLKNMKICIY